MTFDEWLDKEFYDARAYVCHVIMRTALNLELSDKTGKHLIYSSQEFRKGYIDNSKMDNEPLSDYYTRMFLSQTCNEKTKQ